MSATRRIALPQAHRPEQHRHLVAEVVADERERAAGQPGRQRAGGRLVGPDRPPGRHRPAPGSPRPRRCAGRRPARSRRPARRSRSSPRGCAPARPTPASIASRSSSLSGSELVLTRTGRIVEVARARGPRQASDHRGVADEMGRLRSRHRAQHLLERRRRRDHDGLHRPPPSRRRTTACWRAAAHPPRAPPAARDRALSRTARSARACHRHARQASVTNCSQPHRYTPRTPLDPPELNTCRSEGV